MYRFVEKYYALITPLSLYRCTFEIGAMVYEITFSPRTQLRLLRGLGGLSLEEMAVYDSLRDMEKILDDHANRQMLIECRDQRFSEIYRAYSAIEGNDNKPSFHKWYHELLRRFDERIEKSEA